MMMMATLLMVMVLCWWWVMVTLLTVMVTMLLIAVTLLMVSGDDDRNDVATSFPGSFISPLPHPPNEVEWCWCWWWWQCSDSNGGIVVLFVGTGDTSTHQPSPGIVSTLRSSDGSFTTWLYPYGNAQPIRTRFTNWKTHQTPYQPCAPGRSTPRCSRRFHLFPRRAAADGNSSECPRKRPSLPREWSGNWPRESVQKTGWGSAYSAEMEKVQKVHSSNV